MRSTKKSTVLVSTAVAAAFALASCGGSDSGASEADVCASIQGIADVFAEDPESETEALDAIAKAADAMDDFVGVAPSEIKGDAEKLADGMRLLADTDPLNPSEEALAALEDESFDEAGENIEEFALETCDIDLDA